MVIVSVSYVLQLAPRQHYPDRVWFPGWLVVSLRFELQDTLLTDDAMIVLAEPLPNENHRVREVSQRITNQPILL